MTLVCEGFSRFGRGRTVDVERRNTTSLARLRHHRRGKPLVITERRIANGNGFVILWSFRYYFDSRETNYDNNKRDRLSRLNDCTSKRNEKSARVWTSSRRRNLLAPSLPPLPHDILLLPPSPPRKPFLPTSFPPGVFDINFTSRC